MAEKKKSVPVVAAPTTDKKKALETAIARIEKDYGKGTIMRLGDDIPVNVESLSTGSLSLDLALGIGGVPRGRIVEIYGPEASGKTTLALHVVASAQKNGGEAAYIDVEHALEPRLRPRPRRRYRQPPHLPAGHRRAGARDRRVRSCAPALLDVRGHRLRRRAHPPRSELEGEVGEHCPSARWRA